MEPGGEEGGKGPRDRIQCGALGGCSYGNRLFFGGRGEGGGKKREVRCPGRAQNTGVVQLNLVDAVGPPRS